MVLIRLILALLLAASAFAPAAAHKDHQKKMAEAAAAAKAKEEAAQRPADAAVAHPMSPAVHEAVKEDVAKMEAEAALPVHWRLLDWLGRIHPFAVHFPLALFPVSWLALILASRRSYSATCRARKNGRADEGDEQRPRNVAPRVRT